MLPPGAGKTVIGLEAARRLGRKIVALVSNTPEGEGMLATQRGEDPLSATTVLRVAWD